jgi:hypothetical protein
MRSSSVGGRSGRNRISDNPGEVWRLEVLAGLMPFFSLGFGLVRLTYPKIFLWPSASMQPIRCCQSHINCGDELVRATPTFLALTEVKGVRIMSEFRNENAKTLPASWIRHPHQLRCKSTLSRFLFVFFVFFLQIPIRRLFPRHSQRRTFVSYAKADAMYI